MFTLQKILLIAIFLMTTSGLAHSYVRKHNTPKYDRKAHNRYNTEESKHTKKYIKSEHDTYNKREKKRWAKHTKNHTKKYYTKYRKFAR